MNNLFTNGMWNAGSVSAFKQEAALVQQQLAEQAALIAAMESVKIRFILRSAGEKGGRFENSYENGTAIGNILDVKLTHNDNPLCLELEDGTKIPMETSDLKDCKILVSLTPEQYADLKGRFNALKPFRETGSRAALVEVSAASIDFGQGLDRSGASVLMVSVQPLKIGAVTPAPMMSGFSSKEEVLAAMQASKQVATTERSASMSRAEARRAQRQQTIAANNAATTAVTESVESTLVSMDTSSGEP
jgi:hypothetical protein